MGAGSVTVAWGAVSRAACAALPADSSPADPGRPGLRPGVAQFESDFAAKRITSAIVATISNVEMAKPTARDIVHTGASS